MTYSARNVGASAPIVEELVPRTDGRRKGQEAAIVVRPVAYERVDFGPITSRLNHLFWPRDSDWLGASPLLSRLFLQRF